MRPIRCIEPRWPARRRVVGTLTVACGVLLVGAPARAQPPSAVPNAESSAPPAPPDAAGMVARLRRGGLVVYFRHAATDHSKGDAEMKDYADCAHQRPLSAEGRRDATEIGRAIRALQLAPGEVLASPYCRTMDHARLMFGHATPRADIRETDAGDYAGLKRLLVSPVAPGRNRWMVGHGIPFRAVAGPPHLEEGEAAVIEPHNTGWTIVARIRVPDWPALAASR